MNTLTLIPYIYEHLILFILAFTRISALFSVFVLFRQDFVNARIIIVFSGLLTLYAIFLCPKPNIHFEIMSIMMLTHLFFQVLVGFLSGLILNITFEIFTSFGQLVSTQTGFAMVTLIDPRLGAITPLTLFYSYVAMLIFLQLNGHLIIIKLMLDSFNTVPILNEMLPKHSFLELLMYSKVMFAGAVFLSITLLITILITNLTLAVMTKFAPQFNLFSIGINISLIIGLFCLYVTFNLFTHNGTFLINEGIEFLQHFILRLKIYGG